MAPTRLRFRLFSPKQTIQPPVPYDPPRQPNRQQLLLGILYWQYFFTPPGGWGNRRSYDLARYWREQGTEVWVLAGGTYFPSPYPKQRAFRTAGVCIVWLPGPYHQKLCMPQRILSFGRFTLWSLYILWRLRHRRLYLLATLPPPLLPWVAAFRFKLTRQPFSLEVYDAWPQVLSLRLPRFLYLPIAWLLQWSYRQAEVLFALSPDIARFLPPERTLLSFNGTRPALFYRRRIPSFLPFRVIYAGTFGWVNHVRFLLQVAKLLQAYRGIVFWLIGDGAERDRLEREAKELPSVRIFPPVPVEEMPCWLSEAHVGVSLVRPQPILFSNSANKFYDYLANGLVVGLNYTGWQAAVLREAQCGFAAMAPERFAAGILRYYWDRAEWHRATERARRWAEKHYDRRYIATQVLQALHQRSPERRLHSEPRTKRNITSS